jgi:predicted NBD/HSP70 family sugar kinase
MCFRLAPKAGIEIPADVTDAEKLKSVQEKLEAGHEGALKIWQSMGVYLGYGIAHYADFYDIKHVLILGRCTSGRGGDLLLEGAKKVFETEFPELVEEDRIAFAR